MMNKVFFRIFIVIAFLLLLFTLIMKAKNTPNGKASGYNNEIFTSNTQEHLIAIHYWYGDTKIIINKDRDMKSIYSELAALKLKKASSDEPRKEGRILVELVMDDKTVEFGLLSNIMYHNGEMYFIDNDVLSLIQEIVEKKL